MKIIYLHQYFRTPEEIGASRSYYIAKAFCDAGYKVIMITTHNEKNYAKKQYEGIEIHYLPIYYSNHLGFWARIYAFLKYCWQSISILKKVGSDAKFCYATSTPLTVGWVALYAWYRFRVPYYFEVRDAWPEIPIALKQLKSIFLQKIAQYSAAQIYKNAQKIITLSPPTQTYLEKKYPQKKILMIPNMADTQYFQPDFSFSTNEPFIVLYAGAIGYANHLESLLTIAKEAIEQGKHNLQFWLIGEGKEKERLQKNTIQQNLQTVVKWLDPLPKKQLPELYAKVQAIYISFLPHPILEWNSPNKFFEGLAAGKICFTNTKGWLKNTIEQHNIGAYLPPENPKQSLLTLCTFAEDYSKVKKGQQNARLLAEKEFSTTLLCQKIIAEL